jgi:hypothetical protein
MANREKPQPKQMEGPRTERDLYRMQGRKRNNDMATCLLISTVTLTTQVQLPLIIFRHQTSETTPL